VHNKAQILYPGIIHLSLEKMDWAKGKQEKKRSTQKDPLLI
jgi:hypothetical protein